MNTVCPNVALVGRPNVGKSTLFNRLARKRIAVVADIAGTTRDRLQYELSVEGRRFVMTDMAGLEPALAQNNEISQGTQAQVATALAEADLVVWVVDGAAGATPEDARIAVLLRELHKPVVIAVNKCDNPKLELNQYEFSQYGFDESVPLSAIHGRGIEALLKAVAVRLPADREVGEIVAEDKELRLGIIGRPNVGKSTLLNSLSNIERSVVSAIAGTTRDSVDTVIKAEDLFPDTFTKWKTVRIIDTAGIRRSGKIGYSIEGWSVIRTLDSLDRSEVALLLIDATEGMVHQDLQIAQEIADSGRAMVLLINKWDTVLARKGIEKDSEAEQAEQTKFLNTMRAQAPFLFWVQVLFMSAQEKINLHVIGKLVVKAYNAWNLKVDPEDLKSFTKEMKKQPAFKSLLDITYEHACPPVFHIHMEGRGLPHFSLNRQMENALRQYFEIGPTVIKIWNVPSVKRRFSK